MGFRTRIKSKIKEALGDVRALFKMVNEEAKHPGRPQPHMVARNPLWGGESGPNPDKTEVLQPEEPSSPPEQKPKNEEEGEQDFWYLRGDDEGWSDPNPGHS